MEDTRKVTKAQVFVRVRPFTDAESKVCPEDSPVPREVITWDSRNTITVLDAANGFAPRKNGQFNVDNVLWSFRDPENPKTVLHTQKDVYAAVVSPMIPQILEGYSTAFCVTGATGSGRVYSLYGDDVDGVNRGILPRFVEEIFTAFKKENRDNTSVSCEVEAIEISSQETYVDLLANRRKGAPAPEDPKLVNDPQEGPKLQGTMRVEAGKSSDVIALLRQIARATAKRNTCHTVHFRFIETYEFEDPEQMGQAVSKSRRINVLFVLLRGMPPAFQRCIDVAVEHDSGENPLAKVPTRETVFTKLYPDLLQQGYNLAFICCVSPFYEHARESLQTIMLASKVSKLKGKPKLMHDQALLEMRNLSDEVKHLKTEVMRQTESMEVVQKEINAREVELMKQEANHHESRQQLRQSENNIAVAKHSVKINLFRSTYQRNKQERQLNEKKKSIAATNSQVEATEKEAAAVKKSSDAATAPLRELQQRIEEEKKQNEDFQARVDKREEQTAEMREMERLNQASPEERKKAVAENHRKKMASHYDATTLQKERKANEAVTAGEEARQRGMQKEYDEVCRAEKGTREKEAAQKEIKRLENEIADTEAEIQRLMAELNKAKPGCGCTLM